MIGWRRRKMQKSVPVLGDVPEFTEYPYGFLGYWVGRLITDETSWASRGLASNYVRSVEAAIEHYRSGRAELVVWLSAEAKLSSFMRATTRFEECIAQMHRAVDCANAIVRTRTVDPHIKGIFRPHPKFLNNSIYGRINEMRNAAQHVHERLINGRLTDGAPLTFVVASQPTLTQANLFDSVQIGTAEVKFSELVAWLSELGAYALRLTEQGSLRSEQG